MCHKKLITYVQTWKYNIRRNANFFELGVVKNFMQKF